jgi:hypothetical protein
MPSMRYPLEVLLKSRNWELDALRQKVGAAREVVWENENAVTRLESDITRAEAHLVQEGSCGLIRVDRRKLVALFLKERRGVLADRNRRLVLEREALARLTEEMTLLRRSLLALERHRERYLKAFAARVEKLQEKALEDTWLSRTLVRERG